MYSGFQLYYWQVEQHNPILRLLTSVCAVFGVKAHKERQAIALSERSLLFCFYSITLALTRGSLSGEKQKTRRLAEDRVMLSGAVHTNSMST